MYSLIFDRIRHGSWIFGELGQEQAKRNGVQKMMDGMIEQNLSKKMGKGWTGERLGGNRVFSNKLLLNAY